jgi:hypothetical protein
MKKRTVITAGVIFVGAFCFGVVGYILSAPLRDVFGPPRITVINMTGEPIHDISVILGSVETELEPIKENRYRTVKIKESFPESATIIEWSDSKGTHRVRADDYVEDYGFYHSEIVLSTEREAIVIWETK